MTLPADNLLRFAREAMATTFELVIATDDPGYAGQAARACWERLESIEAALSRFRPGSSVSMLNRARAGEELILHPDAYACLLIAEEARLASAGSFDVAVGTRGDGSDAALRFFRDASGVRVEREGLSYDLGGIGKGYALDVLAEVLREWGLEKALLHAGGSSVLALKAPVGQEAGWTLHLAGRGATGCLRIRHLAVGASGCGVRGGHIIDPLRGGSAGIRSRIWCLAESAAWADSMSTAAFVQSAGDGFHDGCGLTGVVAESATGNLDLTRPLEGDWPDRILFRTEPSAPADRPVPAARAWRLWAEAKFCNSLQ